MEFQQLTMVDNTPLSKDERGQLKRFLAKLETLRGRAEVLRAKLSLPGWSSPAADLVGGRAVGTVGNPTLSHAASRIQDKAELNRIEEVLTETDTALNSLQPYHRRIIERMYIHKTHTAESCSLDENCADSTIERDASVGLERLSELIGLRPMLSGLRLAENAARK